MLRAIIVLLLAVTVANAFAARPITVEQFEQFLAGTKGRSDTELAAQIAGFTLTERMSSWQLSRLQATVPGEKARHAITALADQSAFLPPPASEVSGAQAPSVVEQRRIISLVATYVSKTIPQLPNFFATRVTRHFEDTPLLQKSGDFIPYEPVHFLNSTSVTISYSNGREIEQGPGGKTTKASPVELGLRTWGVFGPILGVVLLDAAQSKLAWARWEQEGGAPRAVFTYSVPREKSHYEVTYCCIAEEDATLSANVHPFHQVVGYHGDMTVDPLSGTILRLTLEAELKTSDPIAKAAVMVEYGRVEVGGKSYICPIRSVSSTTAQMVQLDPRYKMPLARQLQPLKVRVSDVAFEQYHVFRSDARVLPEAVPEPGTTSSAPRSEQPATAPTEALSAPAAGVQNSTSAETGTAASPSGAGVGAVTPSANQRNPTIVQATQKGTIAPAQSITASQGAPAVQKPAESEISTEAEPGLLEPGTNTATATVDPEFTLRSTTRLVDVAVVAFDKKGHPITDLKPENFEVYDNSTKQKIRFFSQARPESAAASATGPSPTAIEAEPQVYSNRLPAESRASVPVRDAQGGITVLMIDSSNLAWGDLTFARSEMLRFLKSLPVGDRVGLYVLKSHSFQSLLEPTVDRALLAATLSQWTPSAEDLARSQDEERRNRQQIEYVHNVSDLLYANGNSPTGKSDATQAVDPQLRALGSNPARDALATFPGIAQHLAVFPGHKSLIWVSSDNVLADFSDKAPSIERGSKYIEPVTLAAQEALNEAHVSVYPLSASQLEAGGVAASLPHGNVQLTPTANVQVQLAALPPSERQDALEALKKSERDINPGRATAQMQQDTHPIQGEFRELAEATGGRAMRRAGDIAAELNSVVADGRAVYQLSFSPDRPADDTYHHLTVKVAGTKDVTLRYRTGYMFSKDPASLKDRFRQAIWQPRDANEIGITAVIQKDAAGAALKLNIAASDLAISEQGGLWMDKFDIFLIDRDEAAVHAQITGQTLSLRLRSSTYQNSLRDGIDFVLPVHLKPEDGSARVLIIDRNSGRIGSITVPAEPLNPKQ